MLATFRIVRFVPGSICPTSIVSGLTLASARDFEAILDRQNRETGILHFVEGDDGRGVDAILED